MKTDTRIAGYWEFGDDTDIPECAGARTDLLRVKRKIDDGVSNADLWESEYSLMVRHHRAFKEYKRVVSVKRRHITEVITLIGDTGTGKTRWAHDNYPDLYSVAPAKGSGTYFDGYDNHDVVLIDEMYGNRFSHGALLGLLDRYPYTVGIHGGVVNWRPHTIILTSNKSPDCWYDQEKLPYAGGPLERRLTTGPSRVYAMLEGGEMRLDEGEEPEVFGPQNIREFDE